MRMLSLADRAGIALGLFFLTTFLALAGEAKESRTTIDRDTAAPPSGDHGLRTVRIEAGRDATIIENADGSFANGRGPFVFAGRNNLSQDSVRRALLWFDVVHALPRGAVVAKARVILFMSPSNPETRELRLHRVLGTWSEGPSSAEGGSGAPTQVGDATWIHSGFPDRFWLHNGGQFDGDPSARALVGSAGVYVWEEPGLAADVRGWQEDPALNFGWMLIGDETLRQTAKSFASRENDDDSLRPVLEIDYHGRPGPK